MVKVENTRHYLKRKSNEIIRNLTILYVYELPDEVRENIMIELSNSLVHLYKFKIGNYSIYPTVNIVFKYTYGIWGDTIIDRFKVIVTKVHKFKYRNLNSNKLNSMIEIFFRWISEELVTKYSISPREIYHKLLELKF